MVASMTIAQDGSVSDPPDKAEIAKFGLRDRLVSEALELERSGDASRALQALDQALVIERSMKTWQTYSQYQRAMLLSRIGKNADAIEAFRQVFGWDPTRRELKCGAGSFLSVGMDYAILLARNGKEAGAKAIYYYGLKQFNVNGAREIEPVPFVTVFDPEPNGMTYAYSPYRLEAAALMLQSSWSQSDGGTDPIARARQLWPDWFLPIMWQAAGCWLNRSENERLVAEADRLAGQGIGHLFIARYRSDLEAHRALIKAADTPFAENHTQMLEGAKRRAHMTCLEPNPDILSKLAGNRPSQ